MTIRVSIQDMERQIQNFGRSIQNMRRILENLRRLFNVLTTVSWLSPGAMAMAAKTRIKIASFETMIRALEAQVNMLTNAVAALRRAEQQASDQVARLTSNAFRN